MSPFYRFEGLDRREELARLELELDGYREELRLVVREGIWRGFQDRRQVDGVKRDIIRTLGEINAIRAHLDRCAH